MVSARWSMGVALLVLAVGCSSSDQSSTPGRPSRAGTPTTMPWDERHLDGDLVEVRVLDCAAADCPLGIISLARVVEVVDGTPTEARGDTRLAITDETLILGCGPADGRESISFDDLARSRDTEVIGQMPTSVWIGDGDSGDAAGDDGIFPMRASQVVSGSCG